MSYLVPKNFSENNIESLENVFYPNYSVPDNYDETELSIENEFFLEDIMNIVPNHDIILFPKVPTSEIINKEVIFNYLVKTLNITKEFLLNKNNNKEICKKMIVCYLISDCLSKKKLMEMYIKFKEIKKDSY